MDDGHSEPEPGEYPDARDFWPAEEFDSALTEVNGDPFLAGNALGGDWRAGE